MNLELTEDQKMLGDTVRRFVAEQYGFAAREKVLHGEPGWSREIWSAMAELGLLGLPFAEADGGFGGGGVERMIVMEEAGRGLLLEPYFATAILAGGVLRHGASRAQRDALVPALVAGDLILALAHSEADLPRHGFEARTTATRTDTGWALTGAKLAVLHGGSAHHLIVSAKVEGALSLFLVDVAGSGLLLDTRRGYDSIAVSTVTLDNVVVAQDALIGAVGGGAAILDAVFDEANAALVAEAVGVMAEAFDLTVEFLRTRQQFGVTLGSFQALQHRAVDMLIELEMSRSMAVLAALSGDLDPVQRRRNISAAKAQIGKSGRRIAQDAVQMHGAIGVTTEYKVGHALKRLTAIDAMLGDRDHHLGRIVELGGVYADLSMAS